MNRDGPELEKLWFVKSSTNLPVLPTGLWFIRFVVMWTQETLGVSLGGGSLDLWMIC